MRPPFITVKKNGELGTSELHRLLKVEEENAQLKKLVADFSFEKQMPQEVLKKSFKASSSPLGAPIADRGV